MGWYVFIRLVVKVPLLKVESGYASWVDSLLLCALMFCVPV